MPKVSVIIPVYKAELYIERCVRTLFEQTLDDLEYIFVDDCSPDHSIEVMESVLAEYPARKSQVKVIRHEVNQGVSSARQHGVDAATGEYISHCDPDDWVELNMYEALYIEAKVSDADIVGCDYIEEHSNNQIIKRQNLNKPGEYIVSEILRGSIHSSLWSRLISRKLIEQVNAKFVDGITVMEDMLYVIPLHLATDRVVYLSQPLYHYRMVDNSITHTLSRKHIDSTLTVMHSLKRYFEDASKNEASMESKLALRKTWELALCRNAQPLITQPSTYDPARWRRETRGISKPYFGSLKNHISPWLVRHHLDTLNNKIIELWRNL